MSIRADIDQLFVVPPDQAIATVFVWLADTDKPGGTTRTFFNLSVDQIGDIADALDDDTPSVVLRVTGAERVPRRATITINATDINARIDAAIDALALQRFANLQQVDPSTTRTLQDIKDVIIGGRAIRLVFTIADYAAEGALYTVEFAEVALPTIRRIAETLGSDIREIWTKYPLDGGGGNGGWKVS